MTTIRERVILGLSFVLAGVLSLSGLLAYHQGRQEVQALFDAELASSARVLVNLLDGTLASQAADSPVRELNSVQGPAPSPPRPPARGAAHQYEKILAFQIRSSQGQLLARSDTAPGGELAPRRAGYSNKTLDDHHWRVFTLQAGPRWYQVAERDDVRNELSRQIAIQTLLPLILGLPVLALLAFVVLRRSLAPLSELAEQLSARAVNRLEPLPEPDSSGELITIVKALNGLFARLNSAFEREQRFAADAAHELRTPLAALSLHAQNAKRARSEQELSDSLSKMQEGLRRTTHVVEQLLALSRVEPMAIGGSWERVDLAILLQELVNEVRTPGLRHPLTLRITEPEPITGNATLLRLMVRNLIDNARRYSPEGCAIEVRLQGRCLEIGDTGPGIPKELRDRVFERFFRGAASPSEGSGLGLSIVKRIAELHEAAVTLHDQNAGSGLVVQIRFA